MAASGMAVLPSFKMGVTSTDSQLTGACERLSIRIPQLIYRWQGTRYICGGEDILDGLRDLGTDTITLDQGDHVFSLKIAINHVRSEPNKKKSPQSRNISQNNVNLRNCRYSDQRSGQQKKEKSFEIANIHQDPSVP